MICKEITTLVLNPSQLWRLYNKWLFAKTRFLRGINKLAVSLGRHTTNANIKTT